MIEVYETLQTVQPLCQREELVQYYKAFLKLLPYNQPIVADPERQLEFID